MRQHAESYTSERCKYTRRRNCYNIFSMAIKLSSYRDRQMTAGARAKTTYERDIDVMADSLARAILNFRLK